MKWQENDALFKQELEEGYRYQLLVAEKLRSKGFTVEVPALEFRDKIQNASKFLSSVDLITNVGTIEVKSRKIRFTSVEDFPYSTILVDTVAGWEAKEEKPDYYICISTETGCMIGLPGSDNSEWLKQRRFDKTRKIMDTFYEAPLALWNNILPVAQ